MIESYDFGMIRIDGREYTSDVIVFRGKVLDGWWRKEGHQLRVEDLNDIFKVEPQLEVLVIGTGYSDLMKVSHEVENMLRSKGIKLIVEPTKKASQIFNILSQAGRRAVAAFHLTC